MPKKGTKNPTTTTTNTTTNLNFDGFPEYHPEDFGDDINPQINVDKDGFPIYNEEDYVDQDDFPPYNEEDFEDKKKNPGYIFHSAEHLAENEKVLPEIEIIEADTEKYEGVDNFYTEEEVMNLQDISNEIDAEIDDRIVTAPNGNDYIINPNARRIPFESLINDKSEGAFNHTATHANENKFVNEDTIPEFVIGEQERALGIVNAHYERNNGAHAYLAIHADAAKYLTEIRKFAKELNATNSIFSFDSDEYTELNKYLNERFTDEYLQKHHSSIGIPEIKKMLTEITNMCDKYKEKHIEKLNTHEITSLSVRQTKRLAVMSKLTQLNLFADKLSNTENGLDDRGALKARIALKLVNAAAVLAQKNKLPNAKEAEAFQLAGSSKSDLTDAVSAMRDNAKFVDMLNRKTAKDLRKMLTQSDKDLFVQFTNHKVKVIPQKQPEADIPQIHMIG